MPPWVGITIFALVCGGALWKGGWPERLGAVWLAVAWAATYLLRDYRWTQPQWGGLAVDTLFFLGLTVLALRSDRFWPIFAAGFQLLAVITHLARTIDPGLGDWVYLTAGIIWTYLVLFSLAVGTVGCWRARVYSP